MAKLQTHCTVDARATLAEYLRRVIYIVCDVTAPPSFEGAAEEFLFWQARPTVSLSTDGLHASRPETFTKFVNILQHFCNWPLDSVVGLSVALGPRRDSSAGLLFG